MEHSKNLQQCYKKMYIPIWFRFSFKRKYLVTHHYKINKRNDYNINLKVFLGANPLENDWICLLYKCVQGQRHTISHKTPLVSIPTNLKYFKIEYFGTFLEEMHNNQDCSCVCNVFPFLEPQHIITWILPCNQLFCSSLNPQY